MIKNLYCFGDSWGRGAELKRGENPFFFWLQKRLDCKGKNFSADGKSLGIIVKEIVDVSKNFTNQDLVIVVVPPDVRWYFCSTRYNWYTISVNDTDKFSKIFYEDVSPEWFTYQHLLLICTMQSILKDIGCKYVFCHNYGNLDLNKFNFRIDKNNFLSEKSLTELLSNSVQDWNNYNLDKDGPPNNIFSGKYFEGCHFHPNELGHKQIAEMLFEKIMRV